MMRSFVLVCVAIVATSTAASAAAVPTMLYPSIVRPDGFTELGTANKSTLYRIELPRAQADATPSYATPPYLVHLKGSRRQIGYDYAALLHSQTDYTLNTFLNSVFPKQSDQDLLMKFVDFCWSHWLEPHTSSVFLEELAGMQEWYQDHPEWSNETSPDVVSHRFYTLANLPADPQNIIAMLENEFEQGWPEWLKTLINDIIKILEHLVHTCDAYGVWGDRTENGMLYSSRNLDYNPNTGINKYKLVVMYSIDDPSHGGPVPGGTYASIGFSFGLGALAGINERGITTSEMNLDNSVVTFNGVPFPLRLREVLEQSVNLDTAMATWHATNNTNSFNFLVASAPDAAAGRDGAYALETIRDFTGQFGANSPIEANATFDCPDPANTCHKWTNKTGHVRIGFPLPNAVWRTNHGMHPKVMATQEPLFNDTIFRYNLMHDLFVGLDEAQQKINDTYAAAIVATLGIKGENFLTCDQELNGDNVMSIAYAPGPGRSGSSADGGAGHFMIGWESGSGSNWRPGACSPFVYIDLKRWTE